MADTCYYCGQELSGTEIRCPRCGADLSVYREILAIAAYYYNDGLEKANAHDLTGAIKSLREALLYNKYETEARNLLGLCLYAKGDAVEAISEWVISKNLQKDNNLADDYLREIQSRGEISRLNSGIMKYNQALKYCQEGALDLARLQLRRVITDNPEILDAHLLLALILIHNESFEEAEAVLKEAEKRDSKNPRIQAYRNEISRELSAAGEKRRNKRKKAERAEGGHRLPAFFGNLADSRWGALINIAVGFVVGLLVCAFLVVPSIRQQVKSDASKTVVTANEQASKSSTSISQLQKQVSDLKAELEKYTGKSDVVTSYEQLIQASNAVTANDMTTAGQLLSSVNRDLLQSQGQALYDSVNAAVNAKTLEDAYNAGVEAYNKKDYATAITQFTTVTSTDEKYKDGDALYRLGQAYEKNQNTQEAINAYNRVNELFPDSSLGRRAANRSKRLSASQTQ
ncbi:MAG: tetratricopeptide repeat protein [Lachnospiraceae bacterium]|nr:tetratricopeptide repeat protein [Lachnospiraceae bacterium]